MGLLHGVVKKYRGVHGPGVSPSNNTLFKAKPSLSCVRFLPDRGLVLSVSLALVVVFFYFQ